MINMTIKIDLSETKEGHVRSRVAVGVNTQPGSEMPTWALLDHMLRKMDDCLIEAKAQLVKQAKLQEVIQ